MFKIDTDTTVNVMPAPGAPGTPGWFTGGNPGPGAPVPATQLSADWCNGMQGELLSVLTAAGIAPDKTLVNQVLTSILLLIQASAGTYYTDIGAANAYVITPSPAIAAYAAGQRFLMVPAHANTGASTINVNALGVKSIVKPDGSALVPGDIPLSGLVEVVYQAALGKFVLNTTVNSNFTASANGHCYLAGTKFKANWATYSITPGSTTDSPPSTKWGSQTVSWESAFPNQCLFAIPGPTVTANGQFCPVGTAGASTTNVIVYATSWDDPSVGLPLTGIVFGFGF